MKPLILIILDGWGINPKKEANAIASANAPTWNSIYKVYPTTELEASGYAVGLPRGVMGNSEVGHMNIGAGRVVWQDITRIDRAIEDGSFFTIKPFLQTIESIKKSGGVLHLFGLVSDGCVHSAERHYLALIDFVKRNNVPKDRFLFHAFLDGRDTSPTSGVGYIKTLNQKLAGVGRIATIMGRYYAMDRDKRWERTELAFDAIALGKGVREAQNPIEAVEEAYKLGETDEFIKPIVIRDSKVKDGDSIIFFDFRADRTRQLTRAFTEENFDGFKRKATPKVYFATMTSYHEKFTLPIAFAPVALKNILGEVVSRQGLSQLRIAETEKYAHVTFFFNGGSDTPFKGEERILVPSPKVATYDLKPEMSAYEVTDNVLKAINSNKFNLIVLNYANPDMVGHTGIMSAAVKAVEVIDECLGKVLSAVKKSNGIAMITADHGNCEQMIDYNTREPLTAHTTNLVPFVLVSDEHKETRLRDNSLHRDIAPTILGLLNVPQPPEMEGVNLLVT